MPPAEVPGSPPLQATTRRDAAVMTKEPTIRRAVTSFTSHQPRSWLSLSSGLAVGPRQRVYRDEPYFRSAARVGRSMPDAAPDGQASASTAAASLDSPEARREN